MRPVPNHRIELRRDPVKGRGVFAIQQIAPATVIEEAPVVIVPGAECADLERTILHDYYFHWDGDPDGDGSGAVALGFVTLCNHSSRPRARIVRNLDRQTMSLVAIADIAAGDEVTIDYGCDLWFAPQD